MSSSTSQMKRSEVGEVRPSQTLTTYGVASLVDLPNMSVIVMGLDDWPNSSTRILRALNWSGPDRNRMISRSGAQNRQYCRFWIPRNSVSRLSALPSTASRTSQRLW